MNSLRITTTIGLLFVSGAIADEVAIEPQPFHIESSFTANVSPKDNGVPISIDPKTWSQFEILSIAAHGTMLDKDDALLKFDDESLTKKIADTRQAIISSRLAVEAAQQELAALKETAPHRLEAAKREAENAKEQNAYFTKSGREAEELETAQQLARTKQYLENQVEELRQLEQMYKEDDLTEETEEIILTRQKDDVTAAEIRLKLETLRHDRVLNVLLPRRAVTLAHAQRDTAIALEGVEKSIPRDIQMKEAELANLNVQLQRQKESLAELQQDSSLMQITAPTDGQLYYGDFNQGEWVTGDMIKTLTPSGRPPLKRTIATFIPKDTDRVLVAFASEAVARPLEKGLKGIASLTGTGGRSIGVTITEVASAPDPKGRYRIALSADWPADLTPAFGDSAKIRLINYQKEDAIVIPDDTLTFGPKGWTVNLKLADGKTEARPVTLGRKAHGKTEILEGLESGQVIIAPGK